MTDRYFKKHCIDCANFNLETGCRYGISRFDTECMFMPKIEMAIETDYRHREIRCPFITLICNGEDTVCEDCPIDWSKLRINITNVIDYGYGGYVIE